MRRHTLVHQDETCNTFLIEWDPGSGLDWHNHGDSAASILVLSGRLHEYRAESGAEPQGASETLYPGPLYTRPVLMSHRIENPFDEVAISVHTYMPPLNITYPPELELDYEPPHTDPVFATPASG